MISVSMAVVMVMEVPMAWAQSAGGISTPLAASALSAETRQIVSAELQRAALMTSYASADEGFDGRRQNQPSLVYVGGPQAPCARSYKSPCTPTPPPSQPPQLESRYAGAAVPNIIIVMSPQLTYDRGGPGAYERHSVERDHHYRDDEHETTRSYRDGDYRDGHNEHETKSHSVLRELGAAIGVVLKAAFPILGILALAGVFGHIFGNNNSKIVQNCSHCG